MVHQCHHGSFVPKRRTIGKLMGGVGGGAGGGGRRAKYKKNIRARKN